MSCPAGCDHSDGALGLCERHARGRPWSEGGSCGCPDPNSLLTPGQVAKVFHVNPKTVSRWLNAGKLVGVRTPGGHWRVRVSALEELLHDL